MKRLLFYVVTAVIIGLFMGCASKDVRKEGSEKIAPPTDTESQIEFIKNRIKQIDKTIETKEYALSKIRRNTDSRDVRKEAEIIAEIDDLKAERNYTLRELDYLQKIRNGDEPKN